MSDRKWDQEVWSALMEDGTELLDVVINQSDWNKWLDVRQQHKEWRDNPDYNRYAIQYCMWRAAARRGDINPSQLTFPRFIEQVADIRKEATETADPTPPATSDGSP